VITLLKTNGDFIRFILLFNSENMIESGDKVTAWKKNVTITDLLIVRLNRQSTANGNLRCQRIAGCGGSEENNPFFQKS
jgi:hypothetical protein